MWCKLSLVKIYLFSLAKGVVFCHSTKGQGPLFGTNFLKSCFLSKTQKGYTKFA